MWARERRGRRKRRYRGAVNVIAAICVSAAVLGILGFGYGTIPALGPALDPGRGVWTSASAGQPVRSESLNVPGLAGPVTVGFTAQGVASISARSDHDLSLALGYVHAQFRLSEMDLERRLGEGQLAQLGGPSDLASDKFELRLGLLRTAQQEWAQTSGPTRAALLAYAQGVNDDIAQVRARGDWPAVFSLPGVYPKPWTPVDSLVIQGVLTQELDFTTTPLDYALLERSLGAARTMDWFPVIAKNAQSPFDPGPYAHPALTPLPPDAASSLPAGSIAATTTAASTTAAPAATSPASAGADRGTTARSDNTGAAAEAARSLLAQVSQLHAGQVHEYPDSNAWAANGPAVAGGGALLGGDPHLPQTLPSIWYQVALSAPGYDVSGVSVPGVPGVLLGHNAHIAWSLTDTQNQATLFYAERTRGTSYYWRGAWRPMTVEHYTIPVRGGATVNLAVDVTVHGPIMTQAGQTLAVDWMGNVPSADLAALLSVNQATNFAQFRVALAGWHAPSQNFVYADASGNIGDISAGYYPQVAAGCQPWLPMAGTGTCDVTGTIPYAAVPQAYDPPSHVIVTANQRPVTAAYPYYIGTTGDFFDPGYRASYSYAFLRGHQPLTMADVGALQTSLGDLLASRVVPRLVAEVHGGTPAQRAALSLLASWNYSMDASSPAATIWWTFWSDYLSDVFQPWWKAGRVPQGKDVAGLAVSTGLVPLDEDLEAWTLGSPSGGAFSLPSGRARDAASVMRAALASAVASLSRSLGGSPSSWAWGRVHSRSFPSVTGDNGLGYGPRAAGGDPWTVDAADGGMNARVGPSWRMIVSFPRRGPVAAEGVYPGGQSDNPASPWYANLIPLWWDGDYLPLPQPGSTSGPVRWTLNG